MTTPIAPIAFSNIFSEFSTQVGPWPPPGYPTVSMSSYYRGGSYVPVGQATSATDGVAISTSGLIRVGMFRGVTKSTSFPTTFFEHSRIRFGVCTATFTFNTDGTCSVGGTGTLTSTSNPNWFTPTTVGVGSSYWIRFSNVSSAGAGGSLTGSTLNTWLPLSTARAMTNSSGSGGGMIYSMTVELSSSASGSPIVHTNTLDLETINSQL